MQAKDYYGILGVGETATADEIRKAYRRVAKANHPDRNPGDRAAEERFKEASEAYDVLGDPEKRRKFDALRRYGFGEGGFEGFPDGRGAPGGFTFRTGPGGRTIHFDQGQLRDVDFADLFGANSPFSELFDQILRQSGEAPPPRGRAGGGRRARARPRGAAREDPFFRRDGLDVHCTVWLRLDQLDRGARVKVRTPTGQKALVRVPAGTAIGSVLRLPGMGLREGERAGDQYVHIEAVA